MAGIIELARFTDYPDSADRWWQQFAEPRQPEVTLRGPGVINTGSEANYYVEISHDNRPYETEYIEDVNFIVFAADGEIVADGQAELVTEGHWQIVLTEEITTKLQPGTTALEVVTTSTEVSLPSIDKREILTLE